MEWQCGLSTNLWKSRPLARDIELDLNVRDAAVTTAANRGATLWRFGVPSTADLSITALFHQDWKTVTSIYGAVLQLNMNAFRSAWLTRSVTQRHTRSQ
jgi:hypothetical protein